MDTQEPLIPQEQAYESAEAIEMKRRFGRRFWIKLIISVLAVVILGFGIFAYGIYRLGWKGAVVQKIEEVLPYPAAIVDWRTITLADFQKRFTAYEKAVTFNQNFDFSDPKNAEFVKAQKDSLLQRLIDLQTEKILASRYRLSISGDEINTELNAIVQQSGVEMSNLDSVLNTVYGWKKSDFIDQVVIPQLRETKLQVQLASDESANAEAYKKAKEVQDKLANGGDFVKLAAEYSADEVSKDTGGDLGWTSKGSFVPEFENALAGLKVGQVSQIVPTEFGLHIIQLLEKKDENGQSLVHARHILIPTKVYADWLNEEKQQMKIWKLPVF